MPTFYAIPLVSVKRSCLAGPAALGAWPLPRLSPVCNGRGRIIARYWRELALILLRVSAAAVSLGEKKSSFCLHGLGLAVNSFRPMAKALTKSQIAASIAETAGITKKQTGEILEVIAQLAYKNAKNSFTLPGLGKLVLVNRKARMGRNPATGEAIKIPAKKVVKFRVAKAAKDAILSAR
jgi:DNA-binding protein HU-beta